MALVMLPSDLPWWPTVHRKLSAIQKTNNIDKILENMQAIYDLCNVSLDPDDDKRDSTIFNGLKNFIEEDLKLDQKEKFLNYTIKNIAKRAQSIKNLRPPRGLSFSLQQQADSVDLERYFIASLLANAFFSTFPKRTEKTHPTLQDFNFTKFFRSLENNGQKAKLRCFLHYFDWLEEKQFDDNIRISRKVMTGRQWLTIEDWTECSLPLCAIDVRHQGRIENSYNQILQCIFSSARIGGNSLYNGNSQECVQFFTCPESLSCLLFIESLEDNEAILIENVYQITKIINPKGKAIEEILLEPRKVSLCCIDAENYCQLPVNQFEEDNILRELNKCLLAFRQNTTCKIIESKERKPKKDKESNGRLSPIGESGSNSPNDPSTTIIIKQPSTGTLASSDQDSQSLEKDINKRRSWLTPNNCGLNKSGESKGSIVSGPTNSGRRGRFIVLGSSGECLPVNRSPVKRRESDSVYSSCDSDEEFHSAKGSFDDSDDEIWKNQLSKELDTPEKRKNFVKKLQEALKQSSNYTESTASSYAVGISISGSQDGDEAVRLRRGGSTGFVLTEDSLDEEFYNDSLNQEQEWLSKFRTKQQSVLPRKETNDSSKYSFSTDCGSELEEVLEQFSRWMDEPTLKDETKELDPRDEAVLNFANSLLKRTLSESFVGVPITEGCATSVGLPTEETLIQDYKHKKNKPLLNVKSLSLELAKYKHRLAAQLISQLGRRYNGRSGNLLPIATGNWGCGSTRMGNIQLKLIIQWLAASVASLPILAYYTNGHEKLSKLDTLVRVLRDRKWSVGELAVATLEYAKETLESNGTILDDSPNFFEQLIGI